MPDINFTDAVINLIKSETYSEYKTFHDLLVKLPTEEISNSSYHEAADVVNDLTDDILNARYDKYVGLEMKLNTFREIQKKKFDVKGEQVNQYDDKQNNKYSENKGAMRFYEEVDKFLYTRNHVPEAFKSFVTTVLDEYKEQIDNLSNSKNVVDVNSVRDSMREISDRLNRTDKMKAVELLEKRSSEIITSIHDPLSSYYTLNEAVAGAIVSTLSSEQLALIGNVEDKNETQTTTESEVVLAQDVENQIQFNDSYIDAIAIVGDLKKLPPDSEEYISKLNFYKLYLNKIDTVMLQEFYRVAAYIVCRGGVKEAAILLSLL